MTFHTIFILIVVSSTVLFLPGARMSPPDVVVSMETESNNGLLKESKTSLYFMDQICMKNLSLIQLRDRDAVRIAPWSDKYPPPTTACVVGVESFDYQNYRMVLTFKTLKMSPGNNRTDECEKSRLDLYSGRIPSPSNRINGMNGICGRKADNKEYITTGNFILLRYRTYKLPEHTYEYFEAIVTPYHTGKCQSDELKCANGRCISEGLMCDGYNNCGDDSDEKSCSSLGLPLAAIIGIVVGAVVIIGLVIAVAVWRCRRGVREYESI